MNEWKEIIGLLGSDNEKKIKDAVTDIIIDSISESINETYLFSIDDVYNSLGNVFEECIKEAKDKCREKINAIMEENIEKFMKMTLKEVTDDKA